jgi:hypothetical protein
VGYAGEGTVRVEPVVDFPSQRVRGEGCIQPLEEGYREVFMLTPTEYTDPADFRGLESLLMEVRMEATKFNWGKIHDETDSW